MSVWSLSKNTQMYFANGITMAFLAGSEIDINSPCVAYAPIDMCVCFERECEFIKKNYRVPSEILIIS